MCLPFRLSEFERHQVAAPQPLLLATSTIDVAVARSREQDFRAPEHAAGQLAAESARCLRRGV
jgi:hypothetical protein